jgi:uncharacterized protein (UPF0276 family)
METLLQILLSPKDPQLLWEQRFVEAKQWLSKHKEKLSRQEIEGCNTLLDKLQYLYVGAINNPLEFEEFLDYLDSFILRDVRVNSYETSGKGQVSASFKNGEPISDSDLDAIFGR